MSAALTAVLAAVLGALIIGDGRMAGAEPGPTCTDVVTRYAGQEPAGWRVECLAQLPEQWREASGDRPAASMSSRAERRIVILDGQSPEWTEASLAHEIAHAEASSWPSLLRADVARAFGQQSWVGTGGPASPVDVFAESSVRCRGLPTHASFPLVPCDVVEAARRAGGATEPLPVTGGHPRG